MPSPTTTPRVSVVIATYNYAAFLPVAINSALAQTYTDHEIIVVNDGSTDNTDDLMQSYLRHPRLRYYKKATGGQASAKNYGIQKSRGEYVAFLDADDYWTENKLAKQLPLFRNVKVGVVFSHIGVIDRSGNPLPFENPNRFRGAVLPHLYGDNFICFSSSVVRRHLLLEYGSFDESLAMGIDYDLWLRLSLVTEFDYVADPLVAFRSGHGQMSANLEGRAYWTQIIEDRFLAQHPTLITRKMKKLCAFGKAYTAFRHFEARERIQALRAIWKMLLIRPLSTITYKSMARFLLLNALRPLKRTYG